LNELIKALQDLREELFGHHSFRAHYDQTMNANTSGLQESARGQCTHASPDTVPCPQLTLNLSVVKAYYDGYALFKIQMSLSLIV